MGWMGLWFTLPDSHVCFAGYWCRFSLISLAMEEVAAGDFSAAFYEPAFATGRVACKTPAEAANYLQKLKDHESLPDTTWWKKNVMHLLGGEDNLQANTIASIMKTNATLISNPFSGAAVTSFEPTLPGLLWGHLFCPPFN